MAYPLNTGHFQIVICVQASPVSFREANHSPFALSPAQFHLYTLVQPEAEEVHPRLTPPPKRVNGWWPCSLFAETEDIRRGPP